MSEDRKATEAQQPVPQKAPAANKTEDSKDQPAQQQHSFSDWASI